MNRLQIAKSNIVAHFDQKGAHVLKYRELGAILSKEGRSWRLAQNTTVTDFIDFLIESTNLKRFEFPFPNRNETLFAWGKVPTMEMLLHIKTSSYFSHHTAVCMHGLAEQIPPDIYISHERASPSPNANIDQARIDEAFRSPAHATQNAMDFGDRHLVLLNSASSQQLGVVKQTVKYGADEAVLVRLTNIERTLIDAAVRPIYTGGISEVAKAFKFAKEQVSVNRLGAMLKKLSYTYPYHQLIGYYLERAGYRPSQLDLLRRFPMEYDFYLDHGMQNTEYIKDWRLHVPRGF
ncbi:MAG: type IV toxin-antitoxin system AbiEi family antitoxin [Polaromonas sp.]|nr:type IV toxin-antitoxin system AbiEi family antitoxin [Polaromonas sp.]